MKISSNSVQLAKRLVSIQSVSGEEYDVAQYIFKFLRAIKLHPVLQKVAVKRFNVVLPGTGEILVNGHVDTVPLGKTQDWHYNPLGQLSGTKLYGRGTCDTKGAIACVLAALAKNPIRQLNCTFTVGEENTFAGIKAVMKLRRNMLRHVRYCIDLEPTELRIVIAHKGQMSLNITTHGRAAHASVPEKGENAILKLLSPLQALDEYATQLKGRKHPLVGHATLNVGRIEGGMASNVVPDSAAVVIDRRILPTESLSEVEREMKRVVHPAKLEVRHKYQPVELDVNSRIVKLMQEFLQNEGLDQKPRGVTFTTEFSEMVQYGIQGLVFGVGSINQAHQIDEFVELSDLRKGYAIFLRLLAWLRN